MKTSKARKALASGLAAAVVWLSPGLAAHEAFAARAQASGGGGRVVSPVALNIAGTRMPSIGAAPSLGVSLDLTAAGTAALGSISASAAVPGTSAAIPAASALPGAAAPMETGAITAGGAEFPALDGQAASASEAISAPARADGADAPQQLAQDAEKIAEQPGSWSGAGGRVSGVFKRGLSLFGSRRVSSDDSVAALASNAAQGKTALAPATKSGDQEPPADPPQPPAAGDEDAQKKKSANWFLGAMGMVMIGSETIGPALQILLISTFGGVGTMLNIMAAKMGSVFVGKIAAGFVPARAMKAAYGAALAMRFLAMTGLILWCLGPAFMGPLGPLVAGYWSVAGTKVAVATALIVLEAFVAGISGNGGALERPLFQRLVGDNRRDLEQIGSMKEFLNGSASIAGPLLGRKLIQIFNQTLTLIVYPVALLAAAVMFFFKVKLPAEQAPAAAKKDSGPRPNVFKLIMGTPLLRTSVLAFISSILLNYLMFQGMVSAYGVYASGGNERIASSIAAFLFVAISIGQTLGGLINRREGHLLKGEAAKAGWRGWITGAVDALIRKAYLGRWMKEEGGGAVSHEAEDRILDKSLKLWMTITAVLLVPTFLTMLLTNPVLAYALMMPLFVADTIAFNKLLSLMGNQAKEHAGRVFPVVGAMASLVGAITLLIVGQLFTIFAKTSIAPFLWFNVGIFALAIFYVWTITQFHKQTRPKDA